MTLKIVTIVLNVMRQDKVMFVVRETALVFLMS